MKSTEQIVKEAAEAFIKPIKHQLHLGEDEALKSDLIAFGVRLISLQPEWVAINVKGDLPNEPCEMWVFDKPSQKVIRGSFMASQEHYNYWLANASHYMIIEAPQPPTK